MDVVDKEILLALMEFSRISYQTLADQFGLSVNAVKKRIEKLMESGILRGYHLFPSPAMLGADQFLAIITPEDPTPNDAFLDQLGAHSLIYAASYLTDGDVFCFGHYRDSKSLDELGDFLWQLKGVKHIELHTIVQEKGKKCELDVDDLKVLQCLDTDPRMSISNITKQTGLPSRRARKILLKLVGEEGSGVDGYIYSGGIGDSRTPNQSFNLRVTWNLNAGGYTALVIRIGHERGRDTRVRIVKALKKQHSFEFWYAYASAFEPIIFSVYVVEQMKETIQILKQIRDVVGVTSVRAIFGYPTKVYPGLVDEFFDNLFQKLDSE